MGRGNLITLAVFAVVILVFPFVVSNSYYLTVISFTGIYTLICIGLSLLLGYAGQISIGPAGFFAIGAYGSGILTAQFGYSVWTGMIVGLGLSLLVAFLAGIPTLKLRGRYLAMATLGIGEVIHIVAVADTENFVKLFVWIGQKIGLDPKALADTSRRSGPLQVDPPGSPRYLRWESAPGSCPALRNGSTAFGA